MMQPAPGLDRAPRYFVSYRRRAAADVRLARVLVDRLRREGCEVFIDVDMPIGIEWSAEIDRRIEWADFLVVLLSEESVSSEMVQAEVRRAHQAFKARQRSRILPVRVAYTGSLGYELDGYIGQLQYASWADERDDETIARGLLRASSAAGPAGVGAASASAAAAEPSTGVRPLPKADMRALRETMETPGSPLSHDNPFYVARKADERIRELSGGRPRTIIIKGANQTGKSSLLLRFLAGCLAANKRIAFVDLLTFGAVRKSGFAEFAAQFGQVLLEELRLRDVELPPFRRALDVTHFIEDRILPNVDGPLVIAIDEADRIIGAEWQEDFYSALRGWDGNRAHPGKKASWGRLGLALVIATDPRMLIESGYTSPFNVSPPIELGAFSRDDIDTFNACHQGLLDAQQLERLYELLGGHPYLTPLAYYRLVHEDLSFEQLEAEAAREFGPFGDHLRSRLDRLHSAGLTDAMRSILATGAVPNNDRRLYYRLEAAGLVCEREGRLVPRNSLYRQFFSAILQ